jgi:two-component system, NtrC family, response regulator AtoC
LTVDGCILGDWSVGHCIAPLVGGTYGLVSSRLVSSFPSDPTRSHIWDGPATGTRLLVLWEGGSTVRPLAIGDVVVLGRGEECDVQILHKSVSRKHVEVSFADGLRVRDLGSANGTKLGGRRLDRGTTVALPHGAMIEIGAAIAMVQPTSEEPSDVLRHAPPPTDLRGTPSGVGRVADEAADASPSTFSSLGRERVSMAEVWRLVRLVAPSGLPVLLLGETGVGKEVLSTAIHEASPRVNGPLVQINCAAFTETLLESELFGHERGAFTGALTSNEGLLERAHGGTLFLDEIGELPVTLQGKLLRVLEGQEVRRVGATRSRPIDVRFIAATNRDLAVEIQRGQFRSDLYFRLNGLSIHIPPLRERRNEIVPLAKRFLDQACSKLGADPSPLSDEVCASLVAYAWPGNVRELRNIIHRAVVLAAGAPVGIRHLVFEGRQGRDPDEVDTPTSPVTISGASPPTPTLDAGAPLLPQLERLERERIERVLLDSGGNQSLAARTLGMTRRQLIGRIDAYGLPRPRKKQRHD